MIDDLPEDSGDEDWDSESEGSPQDQTLATSQTMSRPGSCYSNHWRLPAETVQQTQFPQPGHPARCLESPLEAIKLERSTSSSPTFDRSMTDPISSYQYVQRPHGSARKPPPLRTTALPQDFRSVPMEQQYSNDTNMETFQSPQAVTTPSYNQLPDTNNFNSAGMYVQPQRYNTFPQARVHDIHLDDSMSVSQKSNAGTPSVGHFPSSAEPMSAQASPFGMGGALSEQLQAYASIMPVQPQQYTEQQASLIEDLRYQMPMASYPAYGGLPVPDWYTNIKPEETWPGYSLPSDRVPSDF